MIISLTSRIGLIHFGVEVTKMCTVYDVASYILAQKGPVTAMKLQKLVYYSQAWSLVWDDKPLFRNKIRAWANGPVCPALYDAHRGQFKVSRLPIGDGRKMNKTQKETINAVLKHYGDKSSWWLSDLTHEETPWINARSGLKSNERGNKEISLADMAEYYSGL